MFGPPRSTKRSPPAFFPLCNTCTITHYPANCFLKYPRLRAKYLATRPHKIAYWAERVRNYETAQAKSCETCGGAHLTENCFLTNAVRREGYLAVRPGQRGMWERRVRAFERARREVSGSTTAIKPMPEAIAEKQDAEEDDSSSSTSVTDTTSRGSSASSFSVSDSNSEKRLNSIAVGDATSKGSNASSFSASDANNEKILNSFSVHDVTNEELINSFWGPKINKNLTKYQQRTVSRWASCWARCKHCNERHRTQDCFLVNTEKRVESVEMFPQTRAYWTEQVKMFEAHLRSRGEYEEEVSVRVETSSQQYHELEHKNADPKPFDWWTWSLPRQAPAKQGQFDSFPLAHKYCAAGFKDHCNNM